MAPQKINVVLIGILIAANFTPTTLAIITIKTTGLPITVQIACDPEVEIANVAGSGIDAQRRQLPAGDWHHIVISCEKPFAFQPKEQLINYISIVGEGMSRAKQLKLPVEDGATLSLKMFNGGDLAIEHPLYLINTTEEMMDVTLNTQELPIATVVRDNDASKGQIPYFDIEQLPWQRALKTRSIKLAPVKRQFSNGCLSARMNDNQSDSPLMYRLYKTAYLFFANNYSDGLSVALAGGIVKAVATNNTIVKTCSLTKLFPLAGEHDIIELSNKQPVSEESQSPFIKQRPEYIKYALNACGIVHQPDNAFEQPAPFIVVHRGESAPEIHAENKLF